MAALIAVARPDPDHLEAVVSPETRWSINGVAQHTESDLVTVVEGAKVRVLSGTVRLKPDSGDLPVLQAGLDGRNHERLRFPGR